MLKDTGIEYICDTMVLEVTKDKTVHCINPKDGYRVLEAKAIVLAMGCRERTRGAISIPGTRPAGVLTAGAAQRYVNIEGHMVGKRVIILGSGDIGLIMARRMTLEGAKVLACVEVMPYSGGLTRNIVQCLNDFDIPLYLSHTIIDIRGKDRVEGVTIAKVGPDRKPIEGTEIDFDCDTVLLSVGLIPENELTRNAGIDVDAKTNGVEVWENMETSVEGIFASGNVVHVHDLVDYVTGESQKAGIAAAEYVKLGSRSRQNAINVVEGDGVGFIVPAKIHREAMDAEIFFRPRRIFETSMITVSDGDKVLAKLKRAHMAPGEMERVRLSRRLLDAIDSDEIIVTAEEVEE